jgi:hypothetical protein
MPSLEIATAMKPLESLCGLMSVHATLAGGELETCATICGVGVLVPRARRLFATPAMPEIAEAQALLSRLA